MTCRRCGVVIPVPTHLAREVLAKLSAVHADGKHIPFIRDLRAASGLDLAAAKALMQHLTHGGTCGWCKAPMPRSAIHECTCGSVSVDLSLIE